MSGLLEPRQLVICFFAPTQPSVEDFSWPRIVFYSTEGDARTVDLGRSHATRRLICLLHFNGAHRANEISRALSVASSQNVGERLAGALQDVGARDLFTRQDSGGAGAPPWALLHTTTDIALAKKAVDIDAWPIAAHLTYGGEGRLIGIPSPAGAGWLRRKHGFLPAGELDLAVTVAQRVRHRTARAAADNEKPARHDSGPEAILAVAGTGKSPAMASDNRNTPSHPALNAAPALELLALPPSGEDDHDYTAIVISPANSRSVSAARRAAARRPWYRVVPGLARIPDKLRLVFLLGIAIAAAIAVAISAGGDPSRLNKPAPARTTPSTSHRTPTIPSTAQSGSPAPSAAKLLTVHVTVNPDGGGDGFYEAIASLHQIRPNVLRSVGCGPLAAAATQDGAADLGGTPVELTVQGLSDQTVVITGIHAHVIHRGGPYRGAFFGCGSEGANPAVTSDFDLDRPDAGPVPDNQPGGTGNLFTRGGDVSLRKGEVQPFRIVGHIARGSARWVLILDLLVGNKTSHLLITDHGHPFATTSGPEDPRGFYERYYASWFFGCGRRPETVLAVSHHDISVDAPYMPAAVRRLCNHGGGTPRVQFVP